MANTYKIIHTEPYVHRLEVGGALRDDVVVNHLIRVVATSDDGHAVRTDNTINLTVDPDNFVDYEKLDKAWFDAVAEKYIEDNNILGVLDAHIEAKKLQPMRKPLPWVKGEESSE